MTSSIVPLSMPGYLPALGSPPPALGRWQVPHATLRSLESCSSQNRILPSTRFGAFYRLRRLAEVLLCRVCLFSISGIYDSQIRQLGGRGWVHSGIYDESV